jgi:excisionase family DNA binding protein
MVTTASHASLARVHAIEGPDEAADELARPDSSNEARLAALQGAQSPYLDDGAAPQVLTVDELAALLRVERKTAYAAIARGEIPGVRRIGGVIRVSREAVLAWLASGQGRVSRSRSHR